MVANILGEEDGRASSNVADNKRNSGTEDDMVIIGCLCVIQENQPEERRAFASNTGEGWSFKRYSMQMQDPRENCRGLNLYVRSNKASLLVVGQL